MEDVDAFAGVTVFVSVARAGSFTKGGERLGLTKSAVAKAITRLETRLGFKLFHRTTRLMRLTSDGEAYLTACLHALDEVTAAQSALSSSSKVLSGRVHINMPIAFGRRVLLPVLGEIVRPHPGIRLTLSFTDAVSDLLQEDVDLAIRFGKLADSDHLVARHLSHQRRVICASPSYLKEFGEPTSMAAVDGHRCIVGTREGPPQIWSVMDGDRVSHYTPPTTHQLSDGEAMVDAAVAGLGLVQLPESILSQQLATGQLREVLVGLSGPDVQVHAVWPKRAQLSPRIRFIVDRLLELAEQGRLR